MKSLYSKVAGGGIQHGSVVTIEDYNSNEHATIILYHRPLSEILISNENGYIIMNEEVIPKIIESKHAAASEMKNEEESCSSTSSGSVLEVEEFSRLSQKRTTDTPQKENTKIIKRSLVCYFSLYFLILILLCVTLGRSSKY